MECPSIYISLSHPENMELEFINPKLTIGNEINLISGHGKTKDQTKLLNWVKLFLAGFFQDDTQYLGAARGEGRPADLKLFSESGGLHQILSSGFSAQVTELLTVKSNKDKTIPNAL